MRKPSVPTIRGARIRAAQKLRVSPRMVKAKYAPSMYSAPWEKLTTVISPKIRLRPMAMSTKIPPSTRPVKAWATSADAEMSITTLGESLLGARPVQLLVGRDFADDVEVSPFALYLLG